jgi:hypothetical protein
MTEKTNDNLTVNHVVAVINGAESSQQAVEQLRAAGYKEPLVLTGEEGAKHIDAHGQEGGIFSRLMRTVEDHLSDSTNYLAQYEEEARAGHHIVTVEVASRDLAERAREVLDHNGAQNIRFFGRLAVTDLSPETNPSHRAETPAEQQKAS